jgi:hypothetical protein
MLLCYWNFLLDQFVPWDQYDQLDLKLLYYWNFPLDQFVP